MTSSRPGSVIYALGEDISDNPRIKNAVEERIQELLEKLKEIQGIIYVNIDKVVLDTDKIHRRGGRSRSRSKSRSRSRTRSRSRSRSHSRNRKGKHHHKYHSRGHRSPHFRHTGCHSHRPWFHHGHHFHQPHFSSSDTGELNCEVTTGSDTFADYKEGKICGRGQRRGHQKRNRRRSRSGSRCGSRCKSMCKDKKNEKASDKKIGSKQAEQGIIVLDQEEPKNDINEDRNLEKQFDSMNFS